MTTTNRMRLTKRAVEALPTPTEQGESTIWDTELSGFGARRGVVGID